jgi:uncharacterized protein (TIGR00290 family)
MAPDGAIRAVTLTVTVSDSAIVSWSGGKDSCLAAHLAVERGARLESLVCMREPGADRSRSHGLPRWVLEAQATAMALPLRLPEAGWSDYEAIFIAELKAAWSRGVRSAVFGDIDLQAHRDWEERVCAAADLSADLPLWLWPRDQVVREVFARGIEAIVVCVNTRWLPASFCGRRYDANFIADLPSGVDACGEQGEFHTCVIAAPAFDCRLDVRVARLRSVRGEAPGPADEYWFAELAPAA